MTRNERSLSETAEIAKLNANKVKNELKLRWGTGRSEKAKPHRRRY